MEQDSHKSRICDLPTEDKPREKALKFGVAQLSPSELLALIFGSGLRGKSVIKLSQDILADVDGRLDILAQMSIAELSSKYAGIGVAKSTSLAAAIELGRRCQQAIELRDRTETRISSAANVFHLMRAKMETLSHEEFWILHLNRANKVTSMDCISIGGTAATLVDVKIIIKKAIDKLSSAIILVHNHPSGNLRPSDADNKLTDKIRRAAELLDIKVLDHVIIGHGDFYSYMNEGIM